jgi:hypothetical protein
MRQAHLSIHLGLTPDSPPLRMGAGKSGVGEGEWKVREMEIL